MSKLIPLDTVQRLVVFDKDALEDFFALEKAESPCFEIALDTETSGLNFPKDFLCSAQIYLPHQHLTLFIPLHGCHFSPAPSTRRMHMQDFAKVLNRFSDEGLVIRFFSSNFDGTFLSRDGVRLRRTVDAYFIANQLQLNNLALKHLVLDLQLVDFQTVTTYNDLVRAALDAGLTPRPSEPGSDMVLFDFLELEKLPVAIKYAQDDAIMTYFVFDELRRMFAEQFYQPEHADTVIQWQSDTAILFSESSAKGYNIDQQMLEASIAQRSANLEQTEQHLFSEIRKIMGWPELTAPPEAPSLFSNTLLGTST